MSEEKFTTLDGQISPDFTPTVTANVFDVNATEFAALAMQRTANYRTLLKTVSELLVEDADYGRIHFSKKCDAAKRGYVCTNQNHYSKHQLRKSGAEKLTALFGLRATFPDSEAFIDAIRRGEQPGLFALRCLLVNEADIVVGEGAGARLVSADYGDFNKALKMAQKSAHIDAVIRTFGLSDRFDAEDGTIYGEEASARTLAESPEALELLQTRAGELFPDPEEAERVIKAMALRMFKIEDGDITKLRASDVPAAIGALEKKRANIDAESARAKGDKEQ